MEIALCLARDFGADVNQANLNGSIAFFIAAQIGHLDAMRCLARDFGADVNQANLNRATALFVAAYVGNLDIVRCMTTELGADINHARHDGFTPLMVAATRNDQALMKHVVHKGAHVGMASMAGHTATTELKGAGATTAQIAYLEVRECCAANPGCNGGGRKRCCVCKETRYCGMACQVAHWRVHRGGCQPPVDEMRNRSRDTP
jgi:hypothetical protein